MGVLSLVGGPGERGAGRVALGHPTGGVAEDGARGVSASTRGAGGPRLPAAAGGATQQELGSRVRSLSGERACWRALLVGRAERRGAGPAGWMWAAGKRDGLRVGLWFWVLGWVFLFYLYFLSLSLFPIQTQLKRYLFEFKFKI